MSEGMKQEEGKDLGSIRERTKVFCEGRCDLRRLEHAGITYACCSGCTLTFEANEVNLDGYRLARREILQRRRSQSA